MSSGGKRRRPGRPVGELKQRVVSQLPVNLAQRLREHADESNSSFSAVVERSLVFYLNSIEDQPAQ